MNLSNVSGGTIDTTGKVVIKLVGNISGKSFNVKAPKADVKDETTGGIITILDVANSSYYYYGTSSILFKDDGGRFVNKNNVPANITLAEGITVSLEGKFGLVIAQGSGAKVKLGENTVINDVKGTVIDEDGEKVVSEKEKKAVSLVEEFEAFVDTKDEVLALVTDGDKRQAVSVKFTPASNAIQQITGEVKEQLTKRLEAANNIVIATSFIDALQTATKDLSNQDNISKANIKLASAKGNLRGLDDGEIKSSLMELVNIEETIILSAELTNSIQMVESSITALKNVGSGLNKGNFTKADSNNVQKQIDEVKLKANKMQDGAVKNSLMESLSTLQNSLTELVNSRYVYYEIVKEATSSTQLKLKLSTDFFAADSPRTQNNNPVNLNRRGENNMVYLSYGNFSFVKPVKGDTATFNMRFNGGYKSIDMTFTNQWDGEWEIVSDWLVEKK